MSPLLLLACTPGTETGAADSGPRHTGVDSEGDDSDSETEVETDSSTEDSEATTVPLPGHDADLVADAKLLADGAGASCCTVGGWPHIAVAGGAFGEGGLALVGTAENARDGGGRVYGFDELPTGVLGMVEAPMILTGAEADGVGDGLGWALTLAGDTDGDGLEEFLVGAPSWCSGDVAYGCEGRAYVFEWSNGGQASTAQAVLMGEVNEGKWLSA